MCVPHLFIRDKAGSVKAEAYDEEQQLVLYEELAASGRSWARRHEAMRDGYWAWPRLSIMSQDMLLNRNHTHVPTATAAATGSYHCSRTSPYHSGAVPCILCRGSPLRGAGLGKSCRSIRRQPREGIPKILAQCDAACAASLCAGRSSNRAGARHDDDRAQGLRKKSYRFDKKSFLLFLG